jgi:hypothetical protein
MSSNLRPTVVLFSLSLLSRLVSAQGLSPRAYVISPIHSNAVTLTYTLQDGNIVFDASVPITGSTGRVGTETATLFHSFNFFSRSANINISLPYSIGHFQADVNGEPIKLYRSGLNSTTIRLSANLFGAPAMTPAEYMKWHQKLIIGASLTVSTATGQYDPALLINIGNNRWAIKPEIGLSRRWNKWYLDTYAAVWFFTPNNDFYRNKPGSTGPNRQTQEPMGSVEAHLVYDVKPRLWFSLDGNYWYGGETSLNGIPTPTTLQANSRLGATASFPIGKHQSLKFSYSAGAYTTFGGDFQAVSAAWQYSWLGRPK